MSHSPPAEVEMAGIDTGSSLAFAKVLTIS
jgi:hypothetical protein